MEVFIRPQSTDGSIRVKIKQKEIDQAILIKMFEKLKTKVHRVNGNGLNSLIKI